MTSRPRALLTKAYEVAELVRVGRDTYEWYENFTTRRKSNLLDYEFIISQGNQAFNHALRLIAGTLPLDAQKTLLAYIDVETFGDWPNERHVWSVNGVPRFSDATPTVIDGVRVLFRIEKPEGASPLGSVPDDLYITANTAEDRARVMRAIEGAMNAPRPQRKPALYSLNGEGEWVVKREVFRRPRNTVVLEEGQIERVLGDLEKFLGDEDRYERVAIPYHRGYLFHGPPGSGKTSLAQVMSTEFGLDLYHLPLRDVKNDVKLEGIIGDVGPRSILLIEDADVFHGSVSREDAEGHATLSGLLNSLDGVITPHGLILVMSSNRREVLDEALLRKGRVDLDEYIGVPNDEQVNRLFEWFYERKPSRPLALGKFSSAAEIVEVFKGHFEDPDGAEEILLAT